MALDSVFEAPKHIHPL